MTRAEIAEVRGVSSEWALSALEERGLVEQQGRADTPGSPILYGTGERFLKLFGLDSRADLPPLEEFALRRRRGRRDPLPAARQRREEGPMSPAQPMNLVVYLARSGVGSRRSCDELIREGVVTVNDEVVTFPRQKVGAEDVVAVHGEPVTARELRYLLVNKPRGVASTRSDPHADRVIVDLVPNGRALFPVGRLDVDTTGLIILTNDGVLANRLMHPRYGVPKTYVARVRGKVSRRALGTLRQGVDLEDGLTSPAEVRLKKQSAKTALVEITIHEGRKRQVRRMFVGRRPARRGAAPPPLRPPHRQGPGARRLPRAHRRRGRGAAPGRGGGRRRGRQRGRGPARAAGRRGGRTRRSR